MKSLIRKTAVSLGIFWLLVSTLWIAISSVVFLKKDEIGKYLLLNVNQIQTGELSVGKVLISPIKQFPRISIILEDLTYFEHKTNTNNVREQPIARVQNFYCGLEILKLLRGNIEISKAGVNNGELEIVIYPDSTVNLINALSTKSFHSKDKVVKSNQVDSAKSALSISIEELEINNMKLKIKNAPDNRESIIQIRKFDAQLNLDEKQINLSFNTSLLIEKLKLAENKYLKNQEISFEVKSQLEKDLGLQVIDGRIEIAGSSFRFEGFFNPADEGNLSMKVHSDGNSNIFSLFAKEKAIKNGDFYLDGLIEGKTFIEFPRIKINFRINNTSLVNSQTSAEIKNLNLIGFFNSGSNKDLSEAKIKIDTLFADLPNGKLNFSGMINNFVKPEYDINLFLNTEVTGLDGIFKLANIDSLKGEIILKDRIKGVYNESVKRFDNEINIAEINFKNFGFIIPGTIRFDKINGSISRNGDSFVLNDIDIKSEDTDFNINGEIDNIQYLIFNIEKDINANLKIKSSVFDLPNFLSFDPSIKRDFPHKILDLDLIVNATTTTSKALRFKSFPQINFNIKKLNATAEGFLPPLKIQSGNFNVSENLLGFHMKFDMFKTGFIGGNLNFSADYNSSSYQPYYIKGEFDMNDLKIAKLFYDEKKDTIPKFFDSKLDGSVGLEFQFASDTNEIKLFKIKNGDISYFFGDDTIQTNSLSFNSENIDFNLNLNDNPFATLYAKGKLKSEIIKTNYFITKDIAFDFLAQNGRYEVETKQVKLFGANSRGEGKFLLSPFSDNPSYRIRYNISSFAIKEMLNTFLEDTVFQGKMALSMDVTMHGNDWNSMIKTMNGYINLSGKNLVMYGVNADKVIAEFQRSQNFNLVDAGAVLLAGPVGLAVTKGSDFARILVTNPGELSQVTHLVSNWKVKHGLLSLEDVAFTTNKNRVAAKGWLNAVTDSLSISFAILNPSGCSIFTQDIYGNLDKPTLGKVHVVSALLAPVTNLYNDIVGNDCVVFYNGSVKQPKGK